MDTPKSEERFVRNPLVEASVAELRRAYEPHIGLPEDTDIVWVLSAPGTYTTMASRKKGGVYSRERHDRMNLLEGFAAARDITARRLGIDVQDVTFADIEKHGPTVYYNGEGTETAGTNYTQNEDLRRAMEKPDFPFPPSKIKIGEIDVANTVAQAKDFGRYLTELQSNGPVGKVAVVSLTSHAPRVARYVQNEINNGVMPGNVEFYGVPVPPSAVSTSGAGVREVRKIVEYSAKGDLAVEPAYDTYYRPHGSEVTRRQEAARERDQSIRDVVTRPFGGEMPDAIVVLSGGIRPSVSSVSETGFKTLSYTDENETHLIVPSKTRVIAGAAIARVIPGIPIITNSFDRTHETDWPSMAQVVADELVNRGVDKDRIVKEEESFNTATQLIEMIKWAVDNNKTRLAIVANDWYFPRLQEFYDRLDTAEYNKRRDTRQLKYILRQFEKMGGQVELIASEEIMYLEEPRYETVVNMAQAAMEATYASEARGLGMLKAGTYTLQLEMPGRRPKWRKK